MRDSGNNVPLVHRESPPREYHYNNPYEPSTAAASYEEL